uniref:Ig-like domain-containing protein n=1 Tax=Strongyloides papillosus TaxID=174720 RepID=A0A0N5BJR5_STREA
MKVLTILIICINILSCNSYYYVIRNYYSSYWKVHAIVLPECLLDNGNKSKIVENVTATLQVQSSQTVSNTSTCGKNLTVAKEHVGDFYIKHGGMITVKYFYQTSEKSFIRKIPDDCEIRAWEDKKGNYYCRFEDINPNKTIITKKEA